LIIYVIFHL
jgi:hypothetical protein